MWGRVNPFLFEYAVNSVLLPHDLIIKDLGVYFYSSFSFTAHCDRVMSSAVRMLGFLIRKPSFVKRSQKNRRTQFSSFKLFSLKVLNFTKKDLVLF